MYKRLIIAFLVSVGLVSGQFTTIPASGGGGVVANTCSGNDKFSAVDSGGNFTCSTDVSGGSPTLDSIADPIAATTLISGATAETFDFDFQAAYTTGYLFTLRGTTGNPSGGNIFQLLSHDAQLDIARFWDGTNGIDIDATGNMTVVGAGTINATLLSSTTLADFLLEAELDTEAELETQITDVSNFIVSTEIDTFSELDALVADETIVNTNDAQTLTNKTINTSGNTITVVEADVSDLSHTTARTDAEIEDLAGGLVTGNTETGITATYQVSDNTLDLIVDNLENLPGAVTDAQVPDTITINTATALAANPASTTGNYCADRNADGSCATQEDLDDLGGTVNSAQIEADTIVASDVDETGAFAFAILTGKQDRNNVAVNDDNCTGEIGNWWYDTTDSKFEFCNANSGTPVAIGDAVGETNNLEVDGAADIADTEFFIGTGAGTGNYVIPSGDVTFTNAGVATLSNANRDHKCSFNLETPTTADDGDFQCEVASASTLIEVACNVEAATSVTVDLYERARATPETGTTGMLTTPLVCDTDGAVTTSFGDAVLAADVPLALGITAVSGTPVKVRVHVKYRLD